MIRDFTLVHLAYLASALRWTIGLSLIAFVGGGLAGAVVAISRVLPSTSARLVTAGYIQLVQGIPLLIQLFLVYFGLSLVGLRVDAWTSVSVALTIYCSAFLGEIWRGAIQAVPREQWEAATALALGYAKSLRLVILPQAIRLAIPPTVGFMVQIIKGTSLASIVGFVELTRAAQIVNNITFRPMLVYTIIAAMYFALCWPISLASRALERRIGTRIGHSQQIL